MEKRDCALEKMGLTGTLHKIGQLYRDYTPVTATKRILYNVFNGEKRLRGGDENPDKTIYIIRGLNQRSPFCTAEVHNLLANYFYVVSHLFYAREKGWIPVVDQQNYPVYNSMDTPINGTMNAWEYFWKQPGGISLEEAYRSRNVVLSKRNWFSQWDMGYEVQRYYDPETIHHYGEICRAIPYQAAIQERIQRERDRYMTGEAILGVNVRMGAHSKQSVFHGAGHPVQPELDELMAILKQRMSEWGYGCIFLAADSEIAVETFRSEFGERLIVFERQRAETGKEYEDDPEKEMYRKDRLYRTTLDYLTEMELLAACDGLIGSITSGFRYAVVRNGGGYRHLEVLDFGLFDKERRKGG